MNAYDLSALGSWSVITAVFIVVISLAYRKFSRRQKDESSSH